MSIVTGDGGLAHNSQYITRWQPYYITAMLGSPANQSDTAVDTGGFENCLLAIAQWYEVA